MIRTATVALFLTLVTFLAGPFLLLHAWLTGKPDLMYRIGTGSVFFISRVVGVRLEVQGQEKVPRGPALFLANHTSFIDAAPIVEALPQRVAVLAKKSLFGWPMIGTAFRLAGFVPVDRSHRETAIAGVELAAERLKQGNSFLAFPEGTRSYDGRLLPFKKGVFVMAIKARARIVPMVAIGAHRVLAKKSMCIRPGKVTVRFGQPIEAAEYALDERDQLSGRVRQAMAALLPPEQQPVDLVAADGAQGQGKGPA